LAHYALPGEHPETDCMRASVGSPRRIMPAAELAAAGGKLNAVPNPGLRFF